MNGLVYSPKEKIPLFKLECNEKGIRSVEYMNSRTSCTERIKVSTLIIYLLDMEVVNRHKAEMIYSPDKNIPIGVMSCDEATGVYFIEVKYKQKREKIRVNTYVSMLLESEALKAG